MGMGTGREDALPPARTRGRLASCPLPPPPPRGPDGRAGVGIGVKASFTTRRPRRRLSPADARPPARPGRLQLPEACSGRHCEPVRGGRLDD